MQQRFGEHHRDTLSSKRSLALALVGLDAQSATERAESGVDGSRRAAAVRSAAASARTGEAVMLYEEAVEGMLAAGESNRGDLMRASNELAHLLGRAGKHGAAATHALRAFSEAARLFEPSSMAIATLATHAANLQYLVGTDEAREEALRLYYTASSVLEMKKGKDHPDTRRVDGMIADLVRWRERRRAGDL
jgi:hypothetical protein